MPIVEYTPALFEDLRKMVSKVTGVVNLAHRPFVDYYYATRDACKLYLYYSESGEVLGTLGRELARFEYNSREVNLRIASNWYSLRIGIGGKLLIHSVQSNPDSVALTFTGSRDTIDILTRQKWIFMPGVRGYFLNNPFRLRPSEPFWRKTVKSVLRSVTRRKIASFAARIPAHISAEIIVREEFSYGPDLLPVKSAFRFRLAPDADYLNWRYNLSLSFMRYRLFRIRRRETTCGYVILSDFPEKIIVAQCDAEDASTLAYGVLLSILEAGRTDARPRTVFLACSHQEMKNIFVDFGFRPQRGGDMPFAFRRQPPQVETSLGTHDWLVNFDWGDNGVRAPFHEHPARLDAGPVDRR
jgi:hypothetical protein